MKPEHWSRVEQVFHAALNVEESRRSTYLQETCAGDEVLHREVELLLAADRKANSFLESPLAELTGTAGETLSVRDFAAAQDDRLQGATVSHYRILKKLGGGGMGVVYQAQDLRLDRLVALKFLPPELHDDPRAVEQLRREARAASALNHPHICTVHDIDEHDGRPFIVMEMLEGQTLKHRIADRRLVEAEVISLGMQIADALDAAHARDIIHRDIKPANIFVTARGQVKVLDFGLAKLLPVETPSTLSTNVAATLAFVGTLPYMAPEQIQGQGVSTRTDIHAIGTVLYEMATGRRPFTDEFPPQLAQTIAHQQPPKPRDLNPRVSPGFEAVILKCLEKDPAKRYQRAQQLQEDLRRLLAAVDARPRRGLYAAISLLGLVLALAVAVFVWKSNSFGWRRTPAIRSIAVLPLVNLSRDPEQEYFADGMTEELTADLGQISALKVISRTSAAQYKGSSKPLPQIGRELDVGALVEGSVRREGNHVRVTAQLIEAATDRHLWAKSYARDIGSILTLQDEVARDIAAEIKVELTREQRTRLSESRNVDPLAYESYLKGRYYWNRRTAQALKKSLEYFQAAIDKDPTYALAYAGVADSYNIQGYYSFGRPEETFPLAKAAAAKAFEIDPALAEAHAALAYAKLYYDFDWQGAEQEYRKAVELNPNYATAHHGYSLYLSSVGRFEEAMAEIRRAQELDPLSPIISNTIAAVYFRARKYDEAVDQLRKTIEMDPNFAVAHYFLAEVYVPMGRFTEALAELRIAETLEPDNPLRQADIGRIYALTGKQADARRILEGLKRISKERYIPSSQFADYYACLGDKDAAMEWLQRAVDERDKGVTRMKFDPMLDNLRSDSRFRDMLRRVGLSQ